MANSCIRQAVLHRGIAAVILAVVFAPVDLAGASRERPQADQQTGASSTQESSGLKSVTRTVRVGARLETGAKAVTNVILTLPVPTDWPEQHVTMFEETIPDEVLRAEYQESETIRRMIARFPKINSRQKVEVKIMFEVTVHEIPPPERTDHLVKPERPPREVRIYLSPSNLIESRKTTMRKQATAIVEGHELAWDQARAIYDWVITNIEVDKKMTETGALKAIKELKGSREDPSYAFVALCRTQKIPARMVWANNGEYTEFYLQDDTGRGRWYPVVLEGKPEFGQMSNPRVIFQKGDNIKVPESTKRMLYVKDSVQGNGNLKSVLWMRDVMQARDSN